REVVGQQDNRQRADDKQRGVPEGETQPEEQGARRTSLRRIHDGDPSSCRRTYPTPRTVWSNFFSNGRSSFSRSRLTSTSTMLVCGSKVYSQTCDRIIVFD